MRNAVHRLLAVASAVMGAAVAQGVWWHASAPSPSPMFAPAQQAALIAVCVLLAMPLLAPTSRGTPRLAQRPLFRFVWLAAAVSVPAVTRPGTVSLAWLVVWYLSYATLMLAAQQAGALIAPGMMAGARVRRQAAVPGRACEIERLDAVRRRIAYDRRKRSTIAVIGHPDACLDVINRSLSCRSSRNDREHLLCWLDPHDPPSHRSTTAAGLRLPQCADFDALLGMLEHRLVDTLWIAVPLDDAQTLTRIAERLRHELVDVRLMPPLRDTPLDAWGYGAARGMASIDLHTVIAPETGLRAKRMFDCLFAGAALATLWPLFVVLAVLIKCSSPGPVFFRQWRRGLDGRPFRIYKFRSMRAHVTVPGELRQAHRRDARVTSIGALMRRTSIDELPQFINVLLGDMSVVGPRPHALEHDTQYKRQVGRYMDRYRVAPGITGWAQVNGWRGETDRLEKMRARVEHDLFYLENRSFMLDLKIVLATVVRGLRSPHAY